jgi:thioesterase domain-containing protein
MLGPKQKFYGIQAPTDKRNAEFVSSIESISQYYVNELVKFQPEGPFLLGGHSTGATIALEMSQQLTARGREVSLLVVFDGELFNTGAEIRFRNPLYWLKLLLNLPHGSPMCWWSNTPFKVFVGWSRTKR